MNAQIEPGEADPGQHETLDLAAITSAALAVPRPGVGQLGLNVHAILWLSIEPARLQEAGQALATHPEIP